MQLTESELIILKGLVRRRLSTEEKRYREGKIQEHALGSSVDYQSQLSFLLDKLERMKLSL